MEKDHFKDRHVDCTFFNKVKVGMNVYICTKEKQRTATSIKDLNVGVVQRVLTKRNHPRGIKVEILQTDGKLAIGRCTYIVEKEGYIFTRNGIRYPDEIA